MLGARRHSNYTVLGKRLRPFSRWHAANLDFIESPLSNPRPRSAAAHAAHSFAGFGHLLLAVECCRLGWPNRLQISNRFLPRAYRLLRQKKYFKHYVRELGNFAGYIAEYTRRPELIVSEDSQPVKTPWYVFEVALLVSLDQSSEPLAAKLGRAWNMPVGEGSWWLAAQEEAAGRKIDLITPEDRSQLREMGL